MAGLEDNVEIRKELFVIAKATLGFQTEGSVCSTSHGGKDVC